LEWAARQTINAIYPDNYRIPDIASLPPEKESKERLENVMPSPTPSSQLASESIQGEEEPCISTSNRCDSMAAVPPSQIDPESASLESSPTTSSAISSEVVDHTPLIANSSDKLSPTFIEEEKKEQEDEDDIPFDEVESACQKPILPPCSENDSDNTPLKENRSNAVVDGEHELSHIGKESPDETLSSDENIDRPAKSLDLDDAVTKVASPERSPGDPTSAASSSAIMESSALSQEYHWKFPSISQRSHIDKSAAHATLWQAQDLEASRVEESAPAYVPRNALSLEEEIFSREYVERERQKAREKLERIKHTIRVVLLTLLFVLPFAIGAYLALIKKDDDDD